MKKGPIKPVRFAVVSGIAASLIFLMLVGILAPGDFWGSVSEFAATLISVIAAFFVGVGLTTVRLEQLTPEEGRTLATPF
jgi:hypothetical protein